MNLDKTSTLNAAMSQSIKNYYLFTFLDCPRNGKYTSIVFDAATNQKVIRRGAA